MPSPATPRSDPPWTDRVVPGRDIHETIDLFLMHQDDERAKHNRQAVSLLLDSTKAYDTLKRDQLLATLAHMGMSEHFCSIVEALHRNTQAVFLVSGFCSSPLQVTRGIRQGCPLEPLPFIMALNPLYEKITTHDQIHGLSLRNSPSETDVAGFADDTNIFLANKLSDEAALAVLASFGQECGLVVNLAKSVVVPLGPQAEDYADPLDTLSSDARVTEYTRYLGIPVGCESATAHAWQLTIRQIQARLVLAEQKTNNAIQRARMAHAIIIPKVQYIARHLWPTREVRKQLQRLIRNFVWRHTASATNRSAG
ncbi:TPA: hypothetical protein N0F65_010695 [Lagenidium giganteum]|uniref:Reverse transcriptase domain-containing protein n=1 Tax=Lagenidium giganteum TaxID=4803 RepID=A0AAV2Z7T1_9STRA|nr:TPA: hypothetical protein N0F65_010695 [Lagenidium giganteum]